MPPCVKPCREGLTPLSVMRAFGVGSGSKRELVTRLLEPEKNSKKRKKHEDEDQDADEDEEEDPYDAVFKNIEASYMQQEEQQNVQSALDRKDEPLQDQCEYGDFPPSRAQSYDVQ